MPGDHSPRYLGDLDLAMRCLQVDSSWYERYWLKERPPRPVGIVVRHWRMALSDLRPACVRAASVIGRAASAIVMRKLKHSAAAMNPASSLRKRGSERISALPRTLPARAYEDTIWNGRP